LISAENISLSFGQRFLFKDVNIKFTHGNCYGIIGANGAGKSTFLKILSGEIEPDTGTVIVTPGERMAVLSQDQFAFDEYSVMNTVIMGYRRLYDIMIEKDALYVKEDFTEADGMRAAVLESDFAELGGWEAESKAAVILSGLGIPVDLHDKMMRDLETNLKVRVLLAQALFGAPDILILDEPTNNLDLESISWLETFLSDFNNTVIVVSHDRHFLNRICTHVADIDFGKINVYVGNYDFWYQSAQLALIQQKDDKRKREDKIADLREFIQRFSANAAKSRQATSRKKLIDKLTIDDLKPSSRKFPYAGFKPLRECGRNILDVTDLSLSLEGETLFQGFNLSVRKGDKIAFIGPLHAAKTAFFRALMKEVEPDAGSITWGATITPDYFPKDNSSYFTGDENLVDWLRRYSGLEEETAVRGFLGRMLFSGEETLKSVSVLSGGERVRCMLSKMMLSGANALILDEPTNHLDLEAITSLNNGLKDFSETVLFNSHDHEFVDTIANRLIEFTPGGVIDREMRFDDYLANEEIQAMRDELYHGHKSLVI
jgi:ATPase subunit of ABC transporter with duplicated ATPase domains